MEVLDTLAFITNILLRLGLGAIQMTAGVQRVGWLDEEMSEAETTNAQIVIIWLITIVTTVSVLMGLSQGIRSLSIVGTAQWRSFQP